MQNHNFEDVILQLDNREEIMDYTFPDGTSYWLAVRFSLRFMHMQRLAGDQRSAAPAEHQGKGKLLGYLWHCWRHAPFWNTGKIDILSIANYEGGETIPNRMTVFLKELPEWKKTELLYSTKFRKFHGLKHTASFDYFYYNALIKNKLFGKNRTVRYPDRIEEFVQILRGALAEYISEKEFGELAEILRRAEPLVPNYRKQIQQYLKRKSPKLLVVSEGNNGDWKYSILFDVARSLGIKTTEVQHGLLSLGMYYGEELVKKEVFRNQKTDFMFTFGPYHCTRTNVAPICIPFGHYHLELVKGSIKKRVRTDKEALKIVLICEGVPAVAVNNGLVLRTEAALKKWKQPFELIIRLHPSEEPNEKYEGLMALPGSRYSEYQKENIYQLLEDADVVIGHSSTVLFEAVYFNKTPLICRDAVSDYYIPKELGTWFQDADELYFCLENWDITKEAQHPKKDFFWSSGLVKDNFRRFWKEFMDPEIVQSQMGAVDE